MNHQNVIRHFSMAMIIAGDMYQNMDEDTRRSIIKGIAEMITSTSGQSFICDVNEEVVKHEKSKVL
jgi:hypothetical protein